MTLLPPSSTLFPYTTLFRSDQIGHVVVHLAQLPVECGRDRRLVRRLGQRLDPQIGEQRLRLARSEEHTSNSSHTVISYAVFCLKKKKKKQTSNYINNHKRSR